jgi:hypothetical protein
VAVYRPVRVDLGGELIANDKPLVVSYQGQWYFPVFKRHTEQEFGGQLPFQADYRSDYVQKLIRKDGGWMLFPPIPFSDDTPNYDLNQTGAEPAYVGQLAGHRRPGAGCAGAGDFRCTGVDSVCLDADLCQRPDRHRRRCVCRVITAAGSICSGNVCWKSGRDCRCCTC